MNKWAIVKRNKIWIAKLLFNHHSIEGSSSYFKISIDTLKVQYCFRRLPPSYCQHVLYTSCPSKRDSTASWLTTLGRVARIRRFLWGPSYDLDTRDKQSTSPRARTVILWCAATIKETVKTVILLCAGTTKDKVRTVILWCTASTKDKARTVILRCAATTKETVKQLYCGVLQQPKRQ